MTCNASAQLSQTPCGFHIGEIFKQEVDIFFKQKGVNKALRREINVVLGKICVKFATPVCKSGPDVRFCTVLVERRASLVSLTSSLCVHCLVKGNIAYPITLTLHGNADTAKLKKLLTALTDERAYGKI